MKFRLTVKKAFLLIAGAALIGVAAAILWRIFFLEPQQLVTRSVEVRIPGWPAALKNFRILLIGDLHLVRGDTAYQDKVLAAAGEARADLILLLGDYTRAGDAENPDEAELAAFFRRLSAPCGVFAVYGNHDVWNNRAMVGRAMRAANVHLLVNQWETIHTPDGDIRLFGADDFLTGRTVEFPPPPPGDESVPQLMLCHNPDTVAAAPENSFSCSFAGHLHGGQLRWPWGGTVRPMFDITWYDPGFNRANGNLFYLTSGVGADRFRGRWNCPPEIVLLNMK